MIVKGETGIAINPRALQILYRNQEVNYGVDFRGCKTDSDVIKADEYYIQALFKDSESVILSGGYKTFEEAKKALDDLYQGIEERTTYYCRD
ncbi:hypothetical protein NH288_08500 [Anaerococcus sp. NML200537]|uniref:hypothetical protein n=1 Tax=Anaerococcus sp. NML200537 TaxID=2954485 RepID=UPI0022389E2A|nr:hypothetical protein [Anaerococcus sp. NML200537]MCW6702127.1 hypothetical protein [Anaerococcus sp. NML200537]